MSHICGLDLSGPSNTRDTVLTWFELQAASLSYWDHITDASDEVILSTIQDLAKDDKVILWIDAPLFYNDGGGNRPSDTALRRILNASDLSFIGVLPPTFSKMGWLTMRGIRLTREIKTLPLKHTVSIVEVHPGAATGLRGAPVGALRKYKKGDPKSCRVLKR